MTLWPCPLCNAELNDVFSHQHVKDRSFSLCTVCDLISSDPATWLNPENEKSRYLTHNNSLEDAGYRDYQQTVLNKAFAYFKNPGRLLDFGSGPTPGLSELAKNQGWSSENFDLFFNNTPSVLKQKYNLITAVEVFEHLSDPVETTTLLKSCLEPGGILLIRTEFHQNQEHFSNWWYAKDLTHRIFYSEKSFLWLAHEFNFQLLSNKHPFAILKNT